MSLKLKIEGEIGACSLVWNYGFEIHAKSEAVNQEAEANGDNKATVDLGEIYLGAVTTQSGPALIVTGRGIRSLKRQRQMAQGKLKRQQSKCQKYSRRWRRLQKAKNRLARLVEKQVRDIRHKATRQIVEFAKTHGANTVFIGNPDGVRNKSCGRHHNSRLSQW